MGQFLSDVVHFPHTVPVLGMLEYRSTDNEVITLALLQAYIENQGDGWAYTLNYLESHLELCLTATGPAEHADTEEIHGGYLALVRILGQRTAELHVALGTKTGNAADSVQHVDGRS